MVSGLVSGATGLAFAGVATASNLSGLTAPVVLCPLGPSVFAHLKQSPSTVPARSDVRGPLPLPAGAALYGVDYPGVPLFLEGPSGMRCTASYAADGGEVIELSAPGTAASVSYVYSPGGVGPSTDLACPYIAAVTAVDIAMRGSIAPCRHPAGEKITLIPTGLAASFIALVQVPSGVVDPYIRGSGSLYATEALFTATVYPKVNEAVGQAAACTLPPTSVAQCVGSLAFFLASSDLLTPVDPALGVAVMTPGATTSAVNEIDALLVAKPPPGGAWATSLPTPGQALSNPAVVITSALIAVGGTLFITFPAQLFNLTLDENYAAVEEWFRRWRHRVQRLRQPHRAKAGGSAAPGEAKGRPVQHDERRDRNGLIAVIAAGGLLGSMLDPAFGFNWHSVGHFISVVAALTAGITLSAWALQRYRRKKSWNDPVRVHALPLGLIVALVCVVISRLVDFQPGYLYGVVCGVALSRRITAAEEGQIAALSVVATLTASGLAWLLWVPVNAAASHAGAIFVLTLLDSFLAALFVSGLVGVAISLLPLRFLPGFTISRWHRGAWLALFIVSLFFVVDFLVRSPVSPGSHDSPLITTIVLFVVFAGASVGFREHFARAWRREHGIKLKGFGEWVRDLVQPRHPSEAEVLAAAGGGQIVFDDEEGGGGEAGATASAAADEPSRAAPSHAGTTLPDQQ